MTANYDQNQPMDEAGKWTASGSETSQHAVEKYNAIVSAAERFGSIGDVREVLTGQTGKALLAKLPAGISVEVRVGTVGVDEVAFTQPGTNRRGPRIVITNDREMLMREMDQRTVAGALAQVVAHELDHAIEYATGTAAPPEGSANSAEVVMRKALGKLTPWFDRFES